MQAKLKMKAAHGSARAGLKSEGCKAKKAHFLIQRPKEPPYQVPTHATRGEKYAEGDQHNKNVAILERYLDCVGLQVPQVQNYYSVCLEGMQHTKGKPQLCVFYTSLTCRSAHGSGVSFALSAFCPQAP